MGNSLFIAGYTAGYVSPGVLTDGGGIIITADGHIIHVPPWTGPMQRQFDLGVGLVIGAQTLKEVEFGGEMLALGRELLSGAIQSLKLPQDPIPSHVYVSARYVTAAGYVSPGVLTDAGGIIITADGHIIHVPPWTGPMQKQFDFGVSLVTGAHGLKDRQMSKQMDGLGRKLVAEPAQALMRTLSESTVLLAGK